MRAITRGASWMLLLALGVPAVACAPRILPAPVVTTPRFPGYMFPSVPEALAASPSAPLHDRGWAFLQNGDLQQASREFASALRVSPGFYPAEAGLGYVELAQQHDKEAVAHFDRVLQRGPNYLPALVGRGEALLALKQDEDALASYEAALAIDPDLPVVVGRVEVLRSRNAQDVVSAARRAVQEGNFSAARDEYQRAIASSPESPFLYRELGSVQRRLNDATGALESFRKAVSLDPADVRSHLQISEILEAQGNVQGAIDAALAAQQAEPNPVIQVRVDALRARAELALLPEEYRAIPQANPVTRGELAALIGVRLDDLLLVSRRTEAVVITDTRNHWATPWIMAVARAGVIEVYPNHTFQPRGAVRRGDLAIAVNRLLMLLALRDPEKAKDWQARRRIADVSAANLNYPAVSAAVSSGVLPLLDGDTFQLTRPVTGPEAIAAIERLESLAK